MTTSLWHPPAGLPIRIICATHPDRILKEGAVGPGGEVSHGMCRECAERFCAEAGILFPEHLKENENR